MGKRWVLNKANKQQAEKLQSILKIRSVYCNILTSRGINSFKEAKDFFRPQLNQLHAPAEMKDMAKAVTRINDSLSSQEKILIYGDYDVDGTTAVATVYSFLQEQQPTLSLDFYIPDRYKEGYGISKKGIDYAAKQGIRLLIVLDCGIKAIKQIDYAYSLGIDVIICDHHLPGENLPSAHAILNPKQSDCSYPYKELSGCGLGFKLISALAEDWQLPQKTAFKYLDLVTTSIAADIVPVTGENRVLAFWGLKKLNKNPLPSMKALLEVSGLQSPISIKDVAFMIAPRINAAGRLKHAQMAVNLLIEQHPDKAKQIALELHKLNDERKKLDKNTTEEIIASIQSNSKLKNRKTTVMFQANWHKGVIGIAASKVMETFYRPTIIFSEHEGEITGSARSVKGFNIYNAIKACAQTMERYGGHAFAAGMTLKPNQFELFSQLFEKEVNRTINTDMLIPEIKIDAEVTSDFLTEKCYRMLQQFEPFGPNNEQPVFLLRRVTDNGYSKIVKEKHIRFELIPHKQIHSVAGIGFNLAEKFDIVASGQPFDICFHLEKNNFRGQSKLQLRIIDLKQSDYPAT